MGTFRLTDMDIRWKGTDVTTPPGHCLAQGRDPVGNTRVWLFNAPEPTDEAYRGNLLMPTDPAGLIFAYGPTGTYLASGDDQTELLNQLAGADPAASSLPAPVNHRSAEDPADE
jgi:hypothetical protein